ncbi:hypothetical protein [Streptomyces sp. NPDC127084]|uniref:hypothetical protein n=1 Tax=Streptomyces sp. NPDC127084 TaxID=3347133 RepID=UPI003662D6BA
MPSVLGLLETRERKVRDEVVRLWEEAERVRAALGAAEAALVRLAEAPDGQAGRDRVAVAGSIVPERAEGVGVEGLAPEYQQTLGITVCAERVPDSVASPRTTVW